MTILALLRAVARSFFSRTPNAHDDSLRAGQFSDSCRVYSPWLSYAGYLGTK